MITEEIVEASEELSILIQVAAQTCDAAAEESLEDKKWRLAMIAGIAHRIMNSASEELFVWRDVSKLLYKYT